MVIPGPLVQKSSVPQIIPGVPVKAAEHLMELAVPDGEQVSEPVVLTDQQFRLPVSVAVQQLVLHRFQPLFRGQIPHAFPDGHQVVPFLTEENIAAATLDHGIQDIQFLPIDIISAGSASQSGQADEKNHQTQTGPLLPTLFSFHDAALLIFYVQKSISIYLYYHFTKHKK